MDYISILSIFIFHHENFNLLIVIINKLFSKLAFILSKSKFSGNIIFLSKFPQKHSLFLTFAFIVYISGFNLIHLMLSTLLLNVRSISSNSIHAIGPKITISSSVSKISTAIWPTSLDIFSTFSSVFSFFSFVTQNSFIRLFLLYIII